MLCKLFLFSFFFIFPGVATAAETLEIRNQTSGEILNILVEPEKGKSFFLRLDLAPGAAASVENPDCEAALRADTGLQFWSFPPLSLKDIKLLTFCGDHEACVIVEKKNGETGHESGRIANLVPQKGSKPICELSRFRPGMPMKDVCVFLEPDLAEDDNGALLTGLGFAGMLWAARLVPERNGPVSGNSILEHLELRKPLTDSDITEILNTLYRQGYTPWQAEFPAMDIDFVDMPKKDDSDAKALLADAVQKFLQSWKTGDRAPQINTAADEGAEASIMLAPRTNLEALANADNPSEDVQLFTLTLKPLSSTLLLDVAAYRGSQDAQREQEEIPAR